MSNAAGEQMRERVAWLRQVSPYFRAHRGKTFVVYLSGSALEDENRDGIVHDICLLSSVGIKVVVVFGARPQIDAGLQGQGIESAISGGLRACTQAAMDQIQQIVGALRLQLEAAFTYSHHGAHSARVSSGNFVIARPVGIVNGIDLGFTGQVRRIERAAIEACLEQEEIVLISPLGYSPGGELFNIRATDLAATMASELGAAKLILFEAATRIVDEHGDWCRQMTLAEARAMRGRIDASSIEHELLDTALRACQLGVPRCHILPLEVDGALLSEVLTRDGVGTMVSNAPFDQLRAARTDDVGGILDLVAPLEREGILVKRSREKLEREIDHFMVMVREDTVVACGALYPFDSHGAAEIACVVVHPDYRGSDFGELLLQGLESRATELGMTRVFVLTTHAIQWFGTRGYESASVESLPVERQELYNYQRNSAVLIKQLAG